MMVMPAVSHAADGPSPADEAVAAQVEDPAPVEVVDTLLGDDTTNAVVTADGDSSLIATTDGTVVDVPTDPSAGIEIDTANDGIDVTVTPSDSSLGSFTQDGNVAVANGDGYSTIAQPLTGGDFRLAVVLDDATAPTSYSYDFALPDNTQPVIRPDGGYDFVSPDGTIEGGLAAPWGQDGFGNDVPVSYTFNGPTLTRNIEVTDATVYPVVSNFCMFGHNPNGSCRGAAAGRRLVYDGAWFVAGSMVCAPLSVATTPAGGYLCGATLYALKVAVESRTHHHP